jgi:hypothetical protein
MSTNEITCAAVDERDLDTGYLAGRLSEEQAEAFEAHFFGCERCWTLVQQGLGVRSAFQPDSSPGRFSPSVTGRRARTPRRWWGLAAAAGIAAVALGVWRMSDLSGPSRPEDVFRGEDRAFSVSPLASDAALGVSWPRVATADVYRVRLYAADGMLALEREIADTSLSISRDSVATLPGGAEMFWQVQALDRLRNSVAGSDLTRAVLPQP